MFMIYVDLGALRRLSKIESLRGENLLIIGDGRLHCACGMDTDLGSPVGDLRHW